MTEESAYYKSDKCRDLDEHLGDVHSFITGEPFCLQGGSTPIADHLADKEIEIRAPPPRPTNLDYPR